MLVTKLCRTTIQQSYYVCRSFVVRVFRTYITLLILYRLKERNIHNYQMHKTPQICFVPGSVDLGGFGICWPDRRRGFHSANGAHGYQPSWHYIECRLVARKTDHYARLQPGRKRPVISYCMYRRLRVCGSQIEICADLARLSCHRPGLHLVSESAAGVCQTLVARLQLLSVLTDHVACH